MLQRLSLSTALQPTAILPPPQVIYHLNVKNEDHEIDLNELSEQYESEIEQILRDTETKVTYFKGQLDEQRDSARAADLAKACHACVDAVPCFVRLPSRSVCTSMHAAPLALHSLQFLPRQCSAVDASLYIYATWHHAAFSAYRSQHLICPTPQLLQPVLHAPIHPQTSQLPTPPSPAANRGAV